MSIQNRIEEALDEVRPFLKRDGGDIVLVSVEESVVKIAFKGFCSSCNKSDMTLSSIAAIIKEKVPEITSVIE